jgi:hypothetical protein
MWRFAERIPASTPHVVFADTKLPGTLWERLAPKSSYALLETSYPVLLLGSNSNERSLAITSLLEQNIRDKMPFVYLNGMGDFKQFHRMHALADLHGRAEDMYVLNLLSTQPESHTFDPINPLIGDEESFLALFGEAFGTVLHRLCLCEKIAGDLVDTERFKSFLSLDNLARMVDQDRYADTKEILIAYLSSLNRVYVFNDALHLSADVCERHSIDARVLQHVMNIQPVSLFVEMLDSLPVFSTTPTVDFGQLFKSKKFVTVLLPALEKDPEALGFINTLLTCLLSQQAANFQKGGPYPAVVFDGCFDTQVMRESVLERFEETNTVFTLYAQARKDSPSNSTFATIAVMAEAIICMRMLPMELSELRFDQLGPSNCTAWGPLGVIRGGVIRKLKGDCRFVFRHVTPTFEGAVKLTQAPMSA